MHTERRIKTTTGWGPLFVSLLLIVATIVGLIWSIGEKSTLTLIGSLIGLFLGILTLAGLFVINPNEAVALLLFGAYRGTSKDNGLRWANPFYSKLKLSLILTCHLFSSSTGVPLPK